MTNHFLAGMIISNYPTICFWKMIGWLLGYQVCTEECHQFMHITMAIPINNPSGYQHVPTIHGTKMDDHWKIIGWLLRYLFTSINFWPRPRNSWMPRCPATWLLPLRWPCHCAASAACNACGSGDRVRCRSGGSVQATGREAQGMQSSCWKWLETSWKIWKDMENWGDNHEKMWKVEVKWLWNDPEKWILPAEVVICVASELVIQTFTSEDETIKCGDIMVEHGRTMTDNDVLW